MSHVSFLGPAQLLKPHHQSGHEHDPSGSVVTFKGAFIMQTLKSQLFKDMMLLCSISFTQN